MTQKKKGKQKKHIESYEHRDKERINNPQVGLVTPDNDPDFGEKKIYSYDPHLDPQLIWAGKAERTSFEIPTVSLHVHERIDPLTIIEAVRKQNNDGGGQTQLSIFEVERRKPFREAIEFYKHPHGWCNRLVAGDSLLVMNSLLEKEGMEGKIQMIYIDPPYGIKYGSNFQPFVNKRDVKDGKDEDLTAEPEQIRAFRDTWEVGIHSYLTYLRDRLLLARELLSERGSIFVQISDENIHHVRELMDEIFGNKNFVSIIAYTTTSGFTANTLSRAGDYIVWYAKEVDKVKYRQIFVSKSTPVGYDKTKYDQIELLDGSRRALTRLEKRGSVSLPEGGKLFRYGGIDSQGGSSEPTPFVYKDKTFSPPTGRHWTANYPAGMENLKKCERLGVLGKRLAYIRYFDDFPLQPIHNLWVDIGGSVQSRSDPKVYVVQTGKAPIERCLIMTTDPGDLVLDPTCGSGTTAFVAEQWGRRWITCDTSRVALALARQRLMTAIFDYYELAHPDEGVGSGFKYKVVPRITLKSIANNPDIREGMTKEQIAAAVARHAPQETLYDQPLTDRKRKRVSGPFTVEAVPAPAVKTVSDILSQDLFVEKKIEADISIARSGETLRQGEWRDELLRTGIRGKSGQYIRFARLEPLPGLRWLHADGETRPSDEGADSVMDKGTAYSPKRIVVSFGPDHAPLEQRQVEHAWEEARTLIPRPDMLLFAAFQFDPEAAKDIDEMKPELAGMNFLKAQMNADLLTDDLKKKRAGNDSFWLIGQPDISLELVDKGDDNGKWRVKIAGFDYYNTKTGGIESGGPHQIAVWMLDTDYDGRSLYPRQVFFPQAGSREGWTRLARNLRAEIEPALIEAYQGTVSLPFKPGEHRRIAVKIVDDRGIESLRIMEVE